MGGGGGDSQAKNICKKKKNMIKNVEAIIKLF